MKKKIKTRKPEEVVNIDGKKVRWGDFAKRFLEDIEKQKKAGNQVHQREFILN